jgi:hypothetical protein
MNPTSAQSNNAYGNPDARTPARPSASKTGLEASGGRDDGPGPASGRLNGPNGECTSQTNFVPTMGSIG